MLKKILLKIIWGITPRNKRVHLAKKMGVDIAGGVLYTGMLNLEASLI